MSNNSAFSETNTYINAVSTLIRGRGLHYLVLTFGCQQNESDSEKIRGMCEAMGYTPSPDGERADLLIVNTCAIREHAEMKALSILGNFKSHKIENPDMIIGVVGCMAAEKEVVARIKRSFSFVSFTAEPASLHKIPELVSNAMINGEKSFLATPDSYDIVEDMPVVRLNKFRAWVSVMYGCNNFCSYCIVPYVRGRERSRDSSAIIKECQELISAGVKEITLLGQNVNSYRSDINFAGLVTRISEIEGDFIIRFMTSHPKDTSDELIRAISTSGGKIAPHFHLPLQSGSDAVLKRMNRTYDLERFMSTVDKLRLAVPDIAITTDIIVGFPGESEEDFSKTLGALRRARFDMVYAFIYSERKGTRSATWEDDVSKEIKTDRMTRLLKLQGEISPERNERFVGQTLKVLVESFDGQEGVYIGHSPHNKQVRFACERVEIGSFVNVLIKSAKNTCLIGTVQV